MSVQVIPAILARGYGVSFRSVQFLPGKNGDCVDMVFPKKQERGDLLLGYDDETNVVVPMIRIGHEVTVCIAFTIYMPGIGWKSVDITALPGTMDELQEASSKDTMQIKTMPPACDMSDYEIINAWEEKA